MTFARKAGEGMVVKVGGSLYDLPELGSLLRAWLASLAEEHVLLVPGGGGTACAVRDLDAWHGLGEEAAHWLALRTLTVNAHFLAHLLSGWEVCAPGALEGWRGRAILDAHAFAHADEGRAGCLPHCWEATSDSVAARVAVVSGARELVLLKSVNIPASDWAQAAREGRVDSLFPGILGQAPGLRVRAVNLRGGMG